MLKTQEIRNKVTEEVYEQWKNLDIHTAEPFMLKYVETNILVENNDNLLNNQNELNKAIEHFSGCRGFKLEVSSVKYRQCSSCGHSSKSSWDIKGIRYTIKRLVFRHRGELPKIITEETKKKVLIKIKEDIEAKYDKPYYGGLDCKVMDLYKSEKISWDDIIDSHYKNCEI